MDRNRNGGADTGVTAVALRKESVDRNGKIVIPAPAIMSRSPQGERG